MGGSERKGENEQLRERDEQNEGVGGLINSKK